MLYTRTVLINTAYTKLFDHVETLNDIVDTYQHSVDC